MKKRVALRSCNICRIRPVFINGIFGGEVLPYYWVTKDYFCAVIVKQTSREPGLHFLARDTTYPRLEKLPRLLCGITELGFTFVKREHLRPLTRGDSLSG